MTFRNEFKLRMESLRLAVLKRDWPRAGDPKELHFDERKLESMQQPNNQRPKSPSGVAQRVTLSDMSVDKVSWETG